MDVIFEVGGTYILDFDSLVKDGRGGRVGIGMMVGFMRGPVNEDENFGMRGEIWIGLEWGG